MEGSLVKLKGIGGSVRKGVLHCYSEPNESDEMEFYVKVEGTAFKIEDIAKIEYL